MLRAGANPLAKNAQNTFPFVLAKARDNRAAFEVLAIAALNRAIENKEDRVVLDIIRDYKGQFVNVRTKAGWTPLMYFTAKGDDYAVPEVLKFKANVNMAENDGWTSLMFATNAGNEKLVRLLLTAGADFNQKVGYYLLCNYYFTPIKAASPI